jgi:hypothetical protein
MHSPSRRWERITAPPKDRREACSTAIAHVSRVARQHNRNKRDGVVTGTLEAVQFGINWCRSCRGARTLPLLCRFAPELVLEHPATGERSFVQVKSSADQGVLDDVARFAASGPERMFFVCHSPKGPRGGAAGTRAPWTGMALAAKAVDAGLFGWLMDRMKEALRRRRERGASQCSP